MSGPVLVSAETPPGWVEAAAEVARPPLGNGSGSVLTQWNAWRARSPDEREVLLLGCAATPIPGWVDDMRPSVDARTTALMHASAERVVGVPVESRDDPAAAGRVVLRPVGAPEGAPRLGVARTFVGWSESDVVTCFAICAARSPGEPAQARHGRGCEWSVTRAHLEGGTAPPPPGAVLGALTWAVHHPAQTVTWSGAFVLAAGAVAVASRRRPRSRI